MVVLPFQALIQRKSLGPFAPDIRLSPRLSIAGL
jgi:hypothetical protein